VNRFDWLTGVDHVDRLRRSGGFIEETATQTLAELVTLAFHSIERPLHPAGSAFSTHVEHKHTIGHDPARCDFTDSPDLLGIEAAGMSLIDNIREQITIGYYNSPRCECRPDNLFDELRSGGHVEEHFALAIYRCRRIDRQQEFANAFAQRGAAWVATDDNVEAMTAQRFVKQAHLRRLPDTVDAVERKKQLGVLLYQNARRELTGPLPQRPALSLDRGLGPGG
jgi:hypothetical protein